MKKSYGAAALLTCAVSVFLWVGCKDAVSGNAPNAPAGVTATAQSASSIDVSWNPVPDADSYKVYYGTSSNSIDSLAGTVTGASYTHTGLTAGTTYYYRVKAVNSAGESDYSSFISAATSATGGNGDDITYSVSATGSPTSTDLSFSFSSSVSGLTASDITITTGTGAATKGTLTGSGTSWSLGISTTTAGTISVSISKSGISSDSKTVTLVKSSEGGTTTPNTPIGVTAAAQSSSSIAVSWNPVSDADSYKVYYGTSSNSIDSLADTVTGASYTHTGLTAGTTYYYYIKAVNSAGESDYSSPASATTSGSSGGGTTAPNAPYGIMIRSANTTSSSLQIVWDASLNATSYKLYRSTSSSGTFTVVYSGSATEYTNTGLSSGTTYYYKATAVNSAGESNYTSTVSGTTSGSSGGGATTPGTPTGVTATAQSSSSIRVSWSAVSGATSYKVYYEIGSSPTKNLASGTVTGTSYTHTGLTASTTYYYYIKAVNSAGESDYSFLAVATTSGSSSSTPTKLATPTNLQEYSGDSFVQISWTEVSLAYTYKVYRSTSANGTYSEITVSIGTSGSTVIATDSSPRTGTSYYKVRAIPLSSLSNVTQSDLSAYVRVTR